MVERLEEETKEMEAELERKAAVLRRIDSILRRSEAAHYRLLSSPSWRLLQHPLLRLLALLLRPRRMRALLGAEARWAERLAAERAEQEQRVATLAAAGAQLAGIKRRLDAWRDLRLTVQGF